jgi:hypothetical protein
MLKPCPADVKPRKPRFKMSSLNKVLFDWNRILFGEGGITFRAHCTQKLKVSWHCSCKPTKFFYSGTNLSFGLLLISSPSLSFSPSLSLFYTVKLYSGAGRVGYLFANITLFLLQAARIRPNLDTHSYLLCLHADLGSSLPPHVHLSNSKLLLHQLRHGRVRGSGQRS